MKNQKTFAIYMVAMLTLCTSCMTASALTNKNVKDQDESVKDTPADGTTENTTTSQTTDAKDLFTKRDLEQTPDLTDAKEITVSDNQELTISSAGTYVIRGNAKEASIVVDADDEAKVQLVLDGVSITNTDTPCIYVKNADKVFVTTTDSENSLTVSGTFQADGDTNTDAVIFSKEDLVLNGTGKLVITSTDNAVSSKDTLTITGGTIKIDCDGNALEAHDAVEVADGEITVTSCNDGIHAEDSDDDSKGYVYIGGGTLNITAADDAIHGTTYVQIDDGNLILKSAEGIEATIITINDGTIDISASDDGINAAQKSSNYTPSFELNGGEVTIAMGAGDTDGVDSNGNITINGGTILITGQSTFDYDGTATYNGGTIIENGQETNTITNQMFGGRGGMGGFGGMGNMENMEGKEGFGGRGMMKERQELPEGTDQGFGGEMKGKERMQW